jgi:hypothetical protein
MVAPPSLQLGKRKAECTSPKSKLYLDYLQVSSSALPVAVHAQVFTWYVLLGKLKKDISFALRRGTIAQVTTALDAGQRAAEAELALNMAGWDR